MTHLLTNMLRATHGSFLLGPPGRTRDVLLADPRQQQLLAGLRDAMRGSRLVKLKLYDRGALTGLPNRRSFARHLARRWRWRVATATRRR